MKLQKKILAGVAVVGLALQLVRPAENVATPAGPGDLLAQHPAPEEVRRLLTGACYDCHSDQTRYPWYAEIEPVGWWLAGHVRDGRAALNFSTFGALPAKAGVHLLDQCVDTVNHGEMPPGSYQLLHGAARLTEEEKTLLTAWFQSVGDQISSGGK
jgi:uncharacterized membrane protein